MKNDFWKYLKIYEKEFWKGIRKRISEKDFWKGILKRNSVKKIRKRNSRKEPKKEIWKMEIWKDTLCVPNPKIDPLFRPPIKHAFYYSISYSVSKNRPENSIYRYDFASFKKFSIELFSSIFCNLPPLFSSMLKYWVCFKLEL